MNFTTERLRTFDFEECRTGDQTNTSLCSDSSLSDPMNGFPYPSLYSWTHIILASVFVTAILLVIVFGNGLVTLAIILDRNLTGLQNWFIASLAVSDLLVGLFIMPLSLAKELMGYWMFGDLLCDLWLSTDVLLCTASILNLCLISLDRYWSITRAVAYIRQRTKLRAVAMISSVWATSVLVCLPPLFGWKRPQPTKLGYPLCELSEEPGYVIYSTICSFYLPLVVMVSVYIKIYAAARSRARRNLDKTTQLNRTKGQSRLRQHQRHPYGSKVTDMKCMSFIRKGCSVEGSVTEESSLELHIEQVKLEDIPRATQSYLNHEIIPEIKKTNRESCDKKSKDIGNNKVVFEDNLSSEIETPCLDSVSKTSLIPSVTINITNSQKSPLSESYDLPLEEPAVKDISSFEGKESCQGPLSDYSFTQEHTIDRIPPHSKSEQQELIKLETKYRTFVAYETKRRKITCRISKDFNFSHALMASRSKQVQVQRGSKDSHHDVSSALSDLERGKRKLARVRERRATIVLGIVMASFIGCWLPFFSLYPITLMTGMSVSPHIFSVFFWLGYCNSALNPIIYTIFNRDFRQAFHRILRIRR